MKKTFLHRFLIAAFFISSSFSIADKKDKNVYYPIPEGIDNLLFYIQRSINANTIVYQLNTDHAGNLIEEEPIKVFWINYAKDGNASPLTYIQKNYSYGVKATLVDQETKTYSFKFASYNKRQFFLIKSPKDNKYHVYGQFNNALGILHRVLIDIEGGTFWFPNVKQVAVYAQDVSNDQPLNEIIKP